MLKTYGYVNSVARKLRAGSSAGTCETFSVFMNWPNRARPVPAFLKLIDPTLQQKLIVNELLGNRVALLRRLPVADTCPCACKEDFLRAKGAHRCIVGRDGSPFVRGVASLDANPHHPKQYIFNRERFADELLRWRHASEVAVFDELMCNGDRTHDNLLRIGQHEFLLIDHDQVLGGTGWTRESLPITLGKPTGSNHLADHIIQSQDEIACRRMMKISEEYAKNFVIPRELSKTLAIECRVPADLVEFTIELLNQRMKLLPEIIVGYMRMNQLDLRQRDDD